MNQLPMREIIPNALRFSPWIPWSQRDAIKNSNNYPGVYLLARFLDDAPKRFNMFSKEIVYVGETVGQTLQGRWYQFNRSAFQNKYGHSGGKTHRSEIGGSQRSLFVSALPVTFKNDIFRKAYIRYVERLLLYDYVRHYGDFPTCNRK